jgi:hypothetical protein
MIEGVAVPLTGSGMDFVESWLRCEQGVVCAEIFACTKAV